MSAFKEMDKVTFSGLKKELLSGKKRLVASYFAFMNDDVLTIQSKKKTFRGSVSVYYPSN